VHADGMVMGGMTYQLDPHLERAPKERKGERPINLDDPAIEAAIHDAQLLEEEAERGFIATATEPAEATGADMEEDAKEGSEDTPPQEEQLG